MFGTVDVEVIWGSVAATVKAVEDKQGLEDTPSPLYSVIYLWPLSFIALSTRAKHWKWDNASSFSEANL